MLYTIGHTETYLLGFIKEKLPGAETFRKLGRTDDYPGGTIFKTKREAEQYLIDKDLNNYSVFGVEANWDTGTYYNAKDNTYNLVSTSRLIKI